MAKISLRAYNREIESFIERGQIDEAVAHCKAILSVYPKHIDTYRLLGKAYLESQRYQEASDILQRVLSAVPDDFISQIGMSLIREEEGNLDAAIWHMERAYEVQPANPAIQEELRRLYGSRDGVIPPRVRLTRGALIRMYARGELYQQAIAEIHAALADEPQRTDLEILLARMYFLSNQKAAAADICSQIINLLPYCFEANRILAEILPGSSRAEDAQVFLQRIHAMDPYSAFISADYPSSGSVPDNAVTLNYLEYDASSIVAEPPIWQPAVELEAEPIAPTPEPQIFEELSAETTPTPADIPPQTEPSVPEPDLIPDWMANAGWTTATGPDVAPPPDQMEESDTTSEAVTEGDLAPAELPDWLQSMAPTEASLPAEDERLAELEKILPSMFPEEPAPEGQGLEPHKTDQIIEASDSIPGEIIPENEFPDWLEGLESAAEVGETDALSEGQAPDWLTSLTPGGESELAASSDEIPDWLIAPSGTAEPEVAPVVEEAIEDSSPEVPPVTSDEILDENPHVSAQPPSDNDMDAALAWLEGLAAQQGADAATLATPVDQRPDLPPAWVQETVSDKTTSDLEPSAEISDKLAEVSEPEGESISDSIPTEPIEETPLEAVTKTSIPVIPEEIAPVEEIASDEILTPQTEISGTSLPEESKVPEGISLSDADHLDELTVSPVELPPETHAETPPEDMDAAIAWLESLAAKQGADEETLTTRPEDRLESPPEWIHETAVAEPGEPSSPVETAIEDESLSAVGEFAEVPEASVGPSETVEELVPAAEVEYTETPADILPESPAEPLPEIPEPTAAILTDISVTEVPAEVIPETPIETPVEQVLPSEQTPLLTPEELIMPIMSEPTAEAVENSVLEPARSALRENRLEEAAEEYTKLIQSGTSLDQILADLKEAVYRHPVDFSLWQALGDCYARMDRLSEALEAYNKAEEFLR